MDFLKNCPNCGAAIDAFGFCSSCRSKRDAISWATGISYTAVGTRFGGLDNEISGINLRRMMDKVEEEKKRKASLFKYSSDK